MEGSIRKNALHDCLEFDSRRMRQLLIVAMIHSSAMVLLGQTSVSAFSPGNEIEIRKAEATTELRQEEHQRILGLLPNFNTSNVADAAPLSAVQKFDLAWKGERDPFNLVMTGIDAGLSQKDHDFPGYGQGMRGFAKRFGASYADNFTGTMLGSALFPALLKQDPRYFRKGTGSFVSRLAHAIDSAVICKNDEGKWVPNYSNVLGNLGAGGIANLYYPASDRGLGLTFERALTVTAEGAVGTVFVEFWPDISRKFLTKHKRPEALSP